MKTKSRPSPMLALAQSIVPKVKYLEKCQKHHDDILEIYEICEISNDRLYRQTFKKLRESEEKLREAELDLEDTIFSFRLSF